MLNRWDRFMPLSFHEAGFDTEFKIYRGGTKWDPSISRTGTLNFDANAGEYLLGVGITCIEDVALFAAFVAWRTNKPVRFLFNEKEFVADSGIGIDNLGLPENFREIVEQRFRNVEGTGPLDSEEKVAIGTLAVKLELEYLEYINGA